MPITQERMIAMIEANIEYHNILEDIHATIAEAVARKRAAEQTGENIGEIIETLQNITGSMRPSMETVRAVAKEEGHFTAMRYHNERAKATMEKRRRDQGTSRRWPKESQVRHRVEQTEAAMQGQGLSFHDKMRAQVTMLNIKLDEEERAKATAAAAGPTSEEAPDKSSPDKSSYAQWDQEAIDVEEVWKDDPDSIVGS